MASKASFFPSGKNCKIKVNGVTLAYATDLSYQIQIPHAAPKTLGTYEANSLEPMSYNVSGRFTVIRYVEGAVKKAIDRGSKPPNGASNDGNGVGSWTVNRSNSRASILGRTVGSGGSDGKANLSLNPVALQEAMTFDIEAYQNGNDPLGLARIRNCRITNASTALPIRGIMTQTFDFVAMYVDEDSFIADASGIGQLNS